MNDTRIERVAQAMYDLDPLETGYDELVPWERLAKEFPQYHALQLEKAEAAVAAMEPKPLEDVLLGTLVDKDLPGRDIRIGHSDGIWHVSQEHVGLDDSWPTGVVGTGPTIAAAIRAAIAKAQESAAGVTKGDDDAR